MINLTASCHCKAFTHPISISKEIESKLPITETTCSCDACRYRTGQICILTLSAKLTESIPPPDVLAGLARYDQKCGFSVAPSPSQDNQVEDGHGAEGKTSQDGLNKYSSDPTSCGGTIITSFFCGKCGTKIYLQVASMFTGEVEIGMWMLGCLDKITYVPDKAEEKEEEEKLIIDLKGHHFLNDTIDGGISQLWTQFNGRQLAKYHDSNTPWEPAPSSTVTSELEHKDDMLHLHCKCENFSVHVRRPQPTLPLPKNCFWYQQPYDEKGIPQRYMASWCACTSCRTTTGSSLPAHPWVQIPFIDIFTSSSPSPFSKSSDLTPYIKDKMTSTTILPGLTKYHSTPSNPDISRYFCSTCGASILYFNAERDFIATFAVGLNDFTKNARNGGSEDGGNGNGKGVLNTSWFSWWTGEPGNDWPIINSRKDGEDRWGKKIMDEFEDGLISWGKSIGQRK